MISSVRFETDGSTATFSSMLEKSVVRLVDISRKWDTADRGSVSCCARPWPRLPRVITVPTPTLANVHERYQYKGCNRPPTLYVVSSKNHSLLSQIT